MNKRYELTSKVELKEINIYVELIIHYGKLKGDK